MLLGFVRGLDLYVFRAAYFGLIVWRKNDEDICTTYDVHHCYCQRQSQQLLLLFSYFVIYNTEAECRDNRKLLSPHWLFQQDPMGVGYCDNVLSNGIAGRHDDGKEEIYSETCQCHLFDGKMIFW